MAYTGTGTEQDPYLVDNLTDFLTCIAISGAYVKVISDIDAADDESYTGLLTSKIQVNCRKLYADTEKKITGIVIQDEHFLSINPMYCDVDKIWFKDCKLKAPGAVAGLAVCLISSNDGNTVCSVDGLKFSLQVSGTSVGNFYTFVSGGGGAKKIRNSGVDVTFADSTVTFISTGYYVSEIETTNFVYRNAKWGGSSNQYFTERTKMTNCTIVLDSPACSSTILVGDNAGSGYPWSYCYVALVNPTGSNTPIKNGTLANCYFTIENADGNFDTSAVSDIIITPEHLRDRDYLISVGFLP